MAFFPARLKGLGTGTVLAAFPMGKALGFAGERLGRRIVFDIHHRPKEACRLSGTVFQKKGLFSLIEKWAPDVVIADVNMPEIDGLEMIELARERGSRCRFIICTGYDEVDYLHRAIRQQVAEYLLKPIDRDLLLRKLQEFERQKQIENGEMLSLVKTRLLFRQSDSPFPSPEELCVLFPEREYRLVVIPNEGDATPETLQSLFTPLFPQTALLHRSRNSVLLPACPPALPLPAFRGILRSVLQEKTSRWGCSPPSVL